jgi:hypothetical protein
VVCIQRPSKQIESLVVPWSARFFVVTQIGPSFCCGDGYSFLHTPKAIQGRSNIKREDRRAIGLGRGRVIVDDISHLFTSLRSAYDPVMAIEGRF